jgi:ATP-dependent DNA ligase
VSGGVSHGGNHVSVIGGIVVSLFAVTGDVLKPQSFSGLFGAAPGDTAGLGESGDAQSIQALVFDLLHLDGEDLRPEPLTNRKITLE